MDAADKQWHLTSPTPYDPPLTYGGWVQSRTLGDRIGNILRNRYSQREEASDTSNKSNGVQALGTATEGRNEHSRTRSTTGQHKRRNHKLIIHTSPFLRCIQTSIAISAGIAQHEGSVKTDDQSITTKHHTLHSEAQHPAHSASPYLTGAENSSTPHLSSIPEPENSTDNVTEKEAHVSSQAKTCVRLDAFLGEWLSPEYFDLITPPPSSVMMLTSAKADLMRNGEYIDVPAGSYKNTQDTGNFPGGWGSSSHAASESSQHGDGPLSSIATIGTSLPRGHRASNHSMVNGVIGPRSVSKIETSVARGPIGYQPPMPSYAISPSDPIPPGYVEHARDACVDIDFRWDSMRQPHDWGNGGEFGEEWSGMHKRFRRGLEGMIAWYSNNPPSLSTQTIIEGSDRETETDEPDVDTDIVLILVTHGAGCNALIGALTNQPVLLDVGMASLTMAVRKEHAQERSSSPIAPVQSVRRRSSIDPSISHEYDVKITASTEHLHSRSRTSTTSLPYYSPSLTSFPLATHRYRTNSVASTASSNSLTDGDFRLDSEKHTMIPNGMGGGLARSASSSGGLWSRPVSKTIDGATDRPFKEKAPSSSGHSPLMKEISDERIPSNGGKPASGIMSRVENASGNSGRATTQHGLWGAPNPTTINERENGLKRRWTNFEQR